MAPVAQQLVVWNVFVFILVWQSPRQEFTFTLPRKNCHNSVDLTKLTKWKHTQYLGDSTLITFFDYYCQSQVHFMAYLQ